METLYITEYEATHLRGNLYAVRPKGCLGTCGWKNSIAWTVQYVHARNEAQALAKANRTQG